MSNDLERQIKVMQHYANGGEIEFYEVYNWESCDNNNPPTWNWRDCDYRIKEQKKTVIIEKWLLERDGDITAVEANEEGLLSWSGWNKIRLLETYEVEL